MFRTLKRKIAVLAVVPLALAGCGGGHAKPAAQLPAVSGHQCSAANYAMPCGLRGQRPPAPNTQAIISFGQGVDFAWGGPRSCAAMRSLGARFAVGYLSYDPSKNLGRGLVDVFHQCGIATNAGWETSGGRA